MNNFEIIRQNRQEFSDSYETMNWLTPRKGRNRVPAPGRSDPGDLSKPCRRTRMEVLRDKTVYPCHFPGMRPVRQWGLVLSFYQWDMQWTLLLLPFGTEGKGSTEHQCPGIRESP